MSRVPREYEWSRSERPDPKEDADYLAALRLDEEINGRYSPSLNAGPSMPDYAPEADFAHARQPQFGNSYGLSPAEVNACASPYATHSREETMQPIKAPWALDEQELKVAKYEKENQMQQGPVDQTFETFAAFLQRVKSAKCYECGDVYFQSEGDVSTLLMNWKVKKSVLTPCLECANCKTSSCIICASQPSAEQSFVGVQGHEISWCCIGGRLLLLWLLLCGLNEHFSATKLEDAAPSKKGQQYNLPKQEHQQGRDANMVSSNPFQHGKTYMPSGTGYDSRSTFSTTGESDARSTHTHKGKAKAFSVQQTEDNFYALYLKLVEGLLPSRERECDSNFDLHPPGALVEMLLLSRILSYCTELLRNDSLPDATKRVCLYQALISFLSTLGAHHATADATIFNKRPSQEDRVNILITSFREHPGVAKEKVCSILDSLGNLNTQSEIVLQGAKSNKNEFQTSDGQSLLELCRHISDLRRNLVANSGLEGKSKAEPTEAEVPAMMELPIELIMASHSFAFNAESSHSPLGRLKRIMIEISTLTTSLPPGIFVRYAESRPDVLKFVIIGPAGTPYENGIFEFDMFCDENFPHKPPSVKFKTTGGGRVRFNPNLYKCGWVCLSLLGTWEGEPWIPNESTLLQVVVSIQAMIFCEKPWYNEPANEDLYHLDSASNDSPSAAYNQHIRRYTIRIAMLGWLEELPPLWKDVVEQHFKTNADKILHTAVDWSISKVRMVLDLDGSSLLHPPTHPQEDLASLLPQLQTVLLRYGASQNIIGMPGSVAQRYPTTLPRSPDFRGPGLRYDPSMSFSPAQPFMPQPSQYVSPYAPTNAYSGYPLSAIPENFTEPPRGPIGYIPNRFNNCLEVSKSNHFSGYGGTTSHLPNTGGGGYRSLPSTRGRGGLIPATNAPVTTGNTSSNYLGVSSNITPGGSAFRLPVRGTFSDPGRRGRGRFTDRGRDGRGGLADRGRDSRGGPTPRYPLRGTFTDPGRGGRGRLTAQIQSGRGGFATDPSVRGTVTGPGRGSHGERGDRGVPGDHGGRGGDGRRRGHGRGERGGPNLF